MRVMIPVLLLGLAACAPQVPNSAAPQGVGFGQPGDYAAQSAQRDAQLAGRSLSVNPVISSEQRGVTAVPLPPTNTTPVLTELNADGTTSQTQVASAGPITTNNPSLSDEQSFEAVTGRETIESDKERLARQAAAHIDIAPTAVPDRPGDTGPNIVAYALRTTNSVGQQVYKRSPVNAQSRYDRACAQYTSPDLAQEAFLEMGGPENDRKGMDPDGDGFACLWDPAPFRIAKR